MSETDPAGSPYVFISYASRDRERVVSIVAALREAGITCWLDQHDIAGGSNWGGSIADAIEGCSALVLLASAASLASRNVRQEIALAWQHEKPYLPLLLDATPVPNDVAYWLATAQRIDVLDFPVEVWLPRALSALAGLGGGTGAQLPATVPPGGTTSDGSADSAVLLPTPLTEIIGRHAEIDEITTVLTSARLLTLTGPGGTGKTRLAIAVAHHCIGAFPDGVTFVLLAAIRDPALVVPTIATALNLRETGNEPLLTTLTRTLANQRRLLVLDNLEQVVAAAPEIGALLLGCPYLHVLATSRVPLRLSGEHEFAVSPLLTPDPTSSLAAETLAATPAVRLFVERAQSVRRDFQLTSDNAGAVAAICRRLDGLPLAIELAAARVKHLNPDAMLTRLDRPLAILTGGARDLPTRQQTLRNAIAWSYELLEPGEQDLFRVVSIFRGGWTIEAAVAVAGDDAEIDVIDGLELLVESSLIQVRDQPDGTVRYSMLETIREFGLEQLQEHGEVDLSRRKHLSYMLALTERAEPQFRSTAGSSWFERLESEHDNLRSALQWGIENEPLAALTIAGHVGRFWFARGYLTEGLQWLTATAAMSGTDHPAVRASALAIAGGLSISQGDFTRAWALLSEAHAFAVEASDKPLVCYALNGLGWTKFEQRDLGTARALFEECLSVAREIDDRWRIGMTLTHLGDVSREQGDNTNALLQLDEGLSLIRESGDVGNIAWALDCRARLAFRQKDLDTVRSALHEVLTIRRERQEAEAVTSMEMVAALLAERRRPEQAVQILAACARLREATGYSLQALTTDEHRQLVERLKTHLGNDAFAKHWSAGWRISFDEVIAVALEPDDSSDGAREH